MTRTKTIEKLFMLFGESLQAKCLIINEGKMIDASFAPVPIQRNTPEENKKIKDGEGGDLWNDNPNKKKHKDTDARWVKKGGKSYFGYKNHAKVDVKSKLIDKWAVTDASVHDLQALDILLEESDKGQELYTDSAYAGENQESTMFSKGMVNRVCEKGYRNNPLTDEQKESNRGKSSVRARVEHVFGFMEQSMHGIKCECVGIARATGIMGLMNLTYNLFRYEQIIRLGLLKVKY